LLLSELAGQAQRRIGQAQRFDRSRRLRPAALATGRELVGLVGARGRDLEVPNSIRRLPEWLSPHLFDPTSLPDGYTAGTVYASNRLSLPQHVFSQLSQSQRDRLRHVELRLRFLGEVRRADLMDRFGVQSAAASRDLSLYKDLAPGNVVYDARGKRYLLGQEFQPLFVVRTEKVLTWLTEQLGDVGSPTTEALLPCVSPSRLTAAHADVVAHITRAIHGRQSVEMAYHSISSGIGRREVVPFGLIDTGLRWHVRAFDRKTSAFRDFVLTRISDARPCPDAEPQPHEMADNDLQWTRIVELELVPHPDQPRPEITCMDYGMQDGVLRLKVRAALAGYVMRQWSVDCSPDHHLTGPEHRLWLRDHLALRGVETAVLAPGHIAGSELPA
jgi:hypothetical protein